MRLSTTLRAGSLALVIALAGLTTACASGPANGGSGAGVDSEPGASTEGNKETATGEGTGEGDYAFGANREQMATAIESAFKSVNGKVTWNEDTLILSVDGDATATMAGFQECMVLDQLLNEGDLTIVKFPNGEMDCEEVLADL